MNGSRRMDLKITWASAVCSALLCHCDCQLSFSSNNDDDHYALIERKMGKWDGRQRGVN
jgi:hypothetical protein